MLKLKNIKKVYSLGNDNSVTALDDVNVEFRKSEFVSVLGPSGCGKTTLLNIIGGLDKATGGELIVNNQSTKEFKSQNWDRYRNETLGFVFQSYNLIPHQTILKNVELSLTLTGMDREKRVTKATKVLEKVGLSDQLHKKPNQLSGGQMQRVAIARALVNDPDIILADEPTGALDSESGVQVMKLLKEVAKDRLVIMVTHNETLAETYSTRIIKLKDGKTVFDSNPYKEKEKPKKLPPTKSSIKKKKKQKKLSMSLGTAFSLSLNNLFSKKGRSILTAIAGSIGIIGISLILALSAGVDDYIETIEKDALSLYPLEVRQTDMGLNTIFSILNKGSEEREEYPNSQEIYTKPMLSNVLKNISDLISTNDLAKFKTYADENFDDSLGYVKYDYGVDFNVYSNYVGHEENYMKVNPFIDGMEEIMGDSQLLEGFFNQIKGFANNISTWDEIIAGDEILNQQYELLGESRWPQNKDEVVIVVDEKNQIEDFSLFILGLVHDDYVLQVLAGNEEVINKTYSVEDLLSLQYMVTANADYYYLDESDNWQQHPSRKRDIEFVESNGFPINVVGVVRPKKGAVSTSINGVVGYTSQLKEYMIERAFTHPAVIAQQESPNENIVTGEELTSRELKNQLKKMGVANLEEPDIIRIYAHSFENKNEIINFIDTYNDLDNGETIKYTDTLSIIMGYVDTFTKTVTGVLIGFSAISLIVSSIMIAIIVYTSVLERRKEIGVLRSLGARKKDVSNVFFAESSMLGFASGVFGVFVTFILTLPLNLLLSHMFSVPGLASMKWWHVVMMVGISLVLSIMAGFIPSRMASEQDPVTALRSD